MRPRIKSAAMSLPLRGSVPCGAFVWPVASVIMGGRGGARWWARAAGWAVGDGRGLNPLGFGGLPLNGALADVHARVSQGLADGVQGVALRAKLCDLDGIGPRLAIAAAGRLFGDKLHIVFPPQLRPTVASLLGRE